MTTLKTLDIAFKKARRLYAVMLIEADASEELMRDSMYYKASLVKRRIVAAENALKGGYSQKALGFLENNE